MAQRVDATAEEGMFALPDLWRPSLLASTEDDLSVTQWDKHGELSLHGTLE